MIAEAWDWVSSVKDRHEAGEESVSRLRGLKDSRKRAAQLEHSVAVSVLCEAERRVVHFAEKVGKVTDLLREMNDTAFRLAKDGNRNGVFQLRGAFSGTLQAAQTADGFLSGLVSILD